MPKAEPVKPPQLSDDDKKRAFLAEYEALCHKFGVDHAASPAFIMRDDGTYSIVIQWLITPLPKPPQAGGQ
jgi:hypothetical protein